MKTEQIMWDEEVAKGFVNSLLEDEVIKDFEIMILSNGKCKVTLWLLEP